MGDVLVGGLTFPEAPRWCDGKLWFSDFYSHRVLTVDLAGRLGSATHTAPSASRQIPDGDTLIVAETLTHRLTACHRGRRARDG